MSSMEQLFLNWNGPSGTKDPIPFELQKLPGLYIIEHDSEILYVGKSDESAFKRAKDHFRGQGDSTGRWILERYKENQVKLWIGTTEWSARIKDAEWLFINKFDYPPANVNYRDTPYAGDPLIVINIGNRPVKMSPQIKHP